MNTTNKGTRLMFIGAFTLWALAVVSELAVAKKTQDTGAPAVASGPVIGGTETLLPDGRVLMVGGKTSNGLLRTALSIQDTHTGLFMDVGTLQFPRAFHTATVLPEGTVLILGGRGADG